MKLHLNLKMKNAQAEALYDDFEETVVVLKGSIFEQTVVESFRNHNYFNLRKELIESGKLNSEFVLLENIKFNSLTAAAASIIGRSANGDLDWKLDDGRSFREYILEYNSDITLESDLQKEKYINDFLEDIDILNELKVDYTFNVFETLQIVNKELRHSNFLAWILNPYETHNIKNYFIKMFIRKSFSINRELFQNLGINIDDIFLWDFNEVEVFREFNNIDILLVDKENEFLVVIENKIDSKESKNQLNKYKEIMESKYPSFKKMYLFLTKTGYEASDLETWGSISYEDISEIIERTIPLCSDKVKDFVNDYNQILRRYIMTDEKLINTIQKIYQKHKKALDLIYEYRPDDILNISEFIKNKIKELDGIKSSHSIKNIIRISDNVLENINDMYRDSAAKWVPEQAIILNEIKINSRDIKIMTVVGPSVDESREEVIDYFNLHSHKKTRKNKNFTTLYTTDILRLNEDDDLDLTLDKLEKVLLEKVIKHINAIKDIFRDYTKQ